MKLLSTGNSQGKTQKLIENMKKFLKENSASDVTVNVIYRDTINTTCDTVVMSHQPGSGTAHIVKLFAVSDALKGEYRKLGNPSNFNNNFGEKQQQPQLPAVPGDIIDSGNYFKAIMDELTRILRCKATDIKMPRPSATPINADVSDEAISANITVLMYNEIMLYKARLSKDASAELSFKGGKNKEQISINVDYNNVDQVTDEFGFDIRSDVTVKLGKVANTNDNLGDSSTTQYGEVNAYFESFYKPVDVTLNGNVGWHNANQGRVTIPYRPRLLFNRFVGHKGYGTLGHDLLALAAGDAVAQERNSFKYAYYPDYSLPKNAVSLKNVGALGQDVVINDENKLMYINTNSKACTPDMYAAICDRLFHKEHLIGIVLKPFGPRATTHHVFKDAAIGDEAKRKAAQSKIVEAARTLTDNNFPETKWIGRPIFLTDGTTVQFDGEFLNPLADGGDQWIDLATLQDPVAAANILCNSDKTTDADRQVLREFIECLLPHGNNQQRVHKMFTTMTKMVRGSKFLRINDVKYIPTLDPEFLADLRTALISIVGVKFNQTAPNVVNEQARGETNFDFSKGSFTPGGTGFGAGGNGSTSFGGGWGGNNGWG